MLTGRSTLGLVTLRLLMMHHGLTCDDVNHPQHQDTAMVSEDGLAAYRRGDYNLIRRLLRVLENGNLAKRDVDTAIDACGQVRPLNRPPQSPSPSPSHVIYISLISIHMTTIFTIPVAITIPTGAPCSPGNLGISNENGNGRRS